MLSESFGAAVRREFSDRMAEWARRHRPELWARCQGDPLQVWRQLAELEGAEVREWTGPGRDTVEMWCEVNQQRIIGVVWTFRNDGKLIAFDWYGFDPMEKQKKGPCNQQGPRATLPGVN